ncbi:hypothetical protein SAMN05444141_103569 [Pseudovibrio denitrificans]|uniref:Uncharacterized protein n=1 Tax=Pseudovibrio denitrificans TaxID=258256 RepID=A0A1I7B2F9_9HYPH|nr:hypothetical protein [Pseudovibrio denitrificans]SFT81367.1 hypothetical protein SAMN05444141_103569 [Pseudovibrio denitrificans]
MQKVKVVTQSKLEFEATEGYQEVIAFFEVSLACAQMIDFKKDFSVTGALLLLVPFMFFAMVLAMAGGALLIALGHLTLELYRIVLGSLENAFSKHMMFLTMLGTLFVMPLVTGGSIWLVRKQLQKDDEANSIAFLPTLQRAHQLIVQDLDRVHFLTQAPTLIEPLFFKELSKEKIQC